LTKRWRTAEAHTLRANRRASWWRHVDSRLDDMATVARRRRGETPAASRGDGARRRRREEARARLIYGAEASYSRAGGEIVRRRRRGKWRARGGNFSRCVFARVHRDVARCSRRLTFGAPDSVNTRAPQKICSAAADTAAAGGRAPKNL
jgi:hypothetical protein